MSYEQKAIDIIKTSIKSAIFIDEKARFFFQDSSDLSGENEEKISVDLYDNFKEAGISLAIHKYKIDDEKNASLKDYLFEDRDLVLLDWNLDGESSGQEYSLKLLSDIVTRSHIHFCTIYTSEKGSDIDNVFRNILSYFSNDIGDNYNSIRESLELEKEIIEIQPILDDISINRDSEGQKEKLTALFKSNGKEIKKIKDITEITNNKEAIIAASIALSNTVKSEISLPTPTLTSFENKTLIIDNTIITILNKQENEPNTLISNISKNIIASKSSFTQLLGLEMQAIFSKSSAFIDENLLHFTKEALLYHRENYKKEGIAHFFPEFIKEIMLEKARLNIRNQSLSLLEDSFLNTLNEDVKPEIDELLAMNTFYNSSKLNNDTKLNFGDVFKTEGADEFYICITALCDCLRPEKIANTFFFAKGKPIKKDDALQLGDTAFLSYLSSKVVVAWTDVVSIEDNLHKFSPVYIKPISFTVSEPSFDENESLKLSFIGEENVVKSIDIKYVTTIKANYAQRIANHAFSYPIRIGVDFVKSTPEKKEGKARWQEQKAKYPQVLKELEEFQKLDKRLVNEGVVLPKHSAFKHVPEEVKIDTSVSIPVEEKKTSSSNGQNG